ncbi:MAG: FAD-dependent oxidoreductase, partial [Chloroflexi bacterium]|nr:FAD-dependent oxidoreductase [Chloroflexota bacterium]
LLYLEKARASGADLRNHSAVDFIIVDGRRARGVDFHDVLTGRRSTASGRLVINAAGPWVDAVLDATGRTLRRRIGGTRGSHLVVDLNGRGPKHAVLASAKSDARPMFVTPWLDHHIIGTTDFRDDEDPSDVRAAGWEIDYLIAEAARVLPGLGIEHRNVVYAYSGVRPLARAGDGVFEGAISRRSVIVDHSAEGVERLVSVVGGKLTTAAELGRKVAAAVSQQIGRPRARGIAALPETPTSPAVFLPPETQEHLRSVYGPRAPEVAAYAANDSSLAETISAQHPDIGAQVAYAVQHEGARTVADVLLRRTVVGLTKDMGRAAAAPTAAIMAGLLGWTVEARDQAVRDYFAELHRKFVIIDPEIGIPASERLPDEDLRSAEGAGG